MQEPLVPMQLMSGAACLSYGGMLCPAACTLPWPPPPLPPVSTELVSRVEALESSTRSSRSSLDVEIQLERLRHELKEAEAKTARALKEQQLTSSASSGWQGRLDELQASYDEQFANLAELRQSHSFLVDEKERLKADIEQLRQERASDRKQFQQMKMSLQEVERERDSLQGDLSDIQAGHEELHIGWKQKHDTVLAERDELHTTLHELKERANQHMASSHEWRVKHQEVHDEWRRKHHDLEDSWRKKHQATEDDWRQKHLSMEDEHRSRHQRTVQEKDRLRSDLDQLQTANSSERQNREEVLQRHKAAEKELQDVQRDIQELQATLNEHVDGKGALARQQREIEDEMSRMQADFLALKGDLAREQAAREEAERKHKMVLQDLEKLRADVQTKEDFRDRTLIEKERLEESVLDSETQIRDLKVTKEEEILRLQSMCKEEQAKSQEVEVNMSKTNAELEDLRRRIQQEESDRDHLLKMRDEKRRALEDLKRALEKEREEARMIRAAVEDAKQKKELTTSQASLRQEVRSSQILTQQIEQQIVEEEQNREPHPGRQDAIVVDLLDSETIVAIREPMAAAKTSAVREELIGGGTQQYYNNGSVGGGGPLQRLSAASHSIYGADDQIAVDITGSDTESDLHDINR